MRTMNWLIVSVAGALLLPHVVVETTLIGAAEDAKPGLEFFVSTKGDDTRSGRAAERDVAKQDAAKKRIEALLAREKEIETELPKAADDEARKKLEKEKNDSIAERRGLEPVLAAGPFATLERARDEVRKLKAAGLPTGGVAVWIAAGMYELKQPLAFNAQDSGTAEAPIAWRAKPGDEVRLCAGRAVPEFKPVTDAAVLARLPEIARGKVVQADIKVLGISDFGEMSGGFGKGGLPGIELFINDQPMWVSRYPNEGFIRITEILGKTEENVRGTKGCKEGLFRTDEKRAANWAQEKDPRVLGYWFWDWADERHKVKIDPATLTFEVTKPYHGYGYRKGQWFYGYNLLCEIDQPGEWYLDRETGIAYVWPLENKTASRGMVSLLKEVVTLTGASNITLRGLILEGARATGVELKDCTNCQLVGCVVRNHGSWAVRVEGGKSCAVRGCDVLGTGDGGIALSGGDRKTLTPGGHVAENNHIHHYSRWNRTYRPGISLSGVGQRAANNLIHHAPHQAFAFGGNDHLIEFNEIHNVCEESNDAGVMYAWNDWSARGNMVRHNFIHHVYGHDGKGCSGVYLDDNFSIADIVGNIFYKMPRSIQIGGGRDSNIENNIFVECWPALDIDARGLGWRKDGGPELTKKLKMWPYTEEPWKSRYPKLLTLLEDEPMAPKGHVISRNICVDGKWDGNEAKAKPYLKYVDNLVDEDPKFVDQAKGDFHLKSDSPALKLGFKPIPIEKIGLQKDAARVSWPVEHPITEHEIRYSQKKAAPAVAGGGSTTKPVSISKAGATLPLAQTPGREKLSNTPCSAKVSHDGVALTVVVTVPLKDVAKLAKKGDWGACDGMEVCLRRDDDKKPGPIFIVQGFADGRKQTSEDGGAPKAACAKLGEAFAFAAAIEKDKWVGTFVIPFEALGIAPKPGLKLGFNIGVRRTETDDWIAWTGTNGPNWQLDGAGRIVLE